MDKTKMQITSDFGSDWWNDSCDLKELQDAVDQGAVGATSNPVIIKMVVENKPDEWLPVIDRLISENPNGTEDDITWDLVDDIGTRAAKILEPVYHQTNGSQYYTYGSRADEILRRSNRCATLPAHCTTRSSAIG